MYSNDEDPLLHLLLVSIGYSKEDDFSWLSLVSLITMTTITTKTAYRPATQNSFEIDNLNDHHHHESHLYKDSFNVNSDHEEEEEGINDMDVNDGLFRTQNSSSNSSSNSKAPCSWSPSGSTWKDFWHFSGPGWLLSIAYVDPGNYQA